MKGLSLGKLQGQTLPQTVTIEDCYKEHQAKCLFIMQGEKTHQRGPWELKWTMKLCVALTASALRTL